MTETINDLKNKTANVSLADPDGIISESDLVNVIPEVWGPAIERDAEPLRIFRQFCKVSTDLLNKPGATVKMNKRALVNFDLYGPTTLATDLAEIIPNGELEYNIVELKPYKKSMAFAITQDIIDEAMVDIMADTLREYAENYAQYDDLQIIKAATATTVDDEITYVEATQTGDTYNSGLWTVAKAGTIGMVDCGAKRHNAVIKQLKWSVNQTNIVDGDVMDVGVIIEAQQVIMPSAGFRPTALIMHPKQIADLMRNPMFLDASKAGTNSVLMTGQIMDFLGMKIFASQNLPILACGATGTVKGYQAIMLDQSKALGLAVKKLLTMKSEYKPNLDRYNIYFTWKDDVQRLNSGAIVVINTA